MEGRPGPGGCGPIFLRLNVNPSPTERFPNADLESNIVRHASLVGMIHVCIILIRHGNWVVQPQPPFIHHAHKNIKVIIACKTNCRQSYSLNITQKHNFKPKLF